MCLSLNIGATQLEISTLMRGEIYLNHNPPIIARARKKISKINKPVVSKWLLWDETIEICKNLLEGKIEDFEQNGVAVIDTKDGWSNAVYIPKNVPRRMKDIIKQKHIKGACALPKNNWLFCRELVYENQNKTKIDLVRNNWVRLLDKLDGQVRPLSFKYLRKTGSDIIKEIAGNAIADLYLSHTPKSTSSRHYTNPDYPKLFDALKEMRKRLSSMFEPIKEPRQTSPE